MQKTHRLDKYMRSKMPYSEFMWEKDGSKNYFYDIKTINYKYRFGVMFTYALKQ